MKIAINGSLIDTEHICKIDEIIADRHGHIKFKFFIHLFEKQFIDIIKQSGCYINSDSSYSSIVGREETYEQQKSRTFEELINTPEYQKALKEITDFRDSIIKVWSENQSKIPQYNLE